MEIIIDYYIIISINQPVVLTGDVSWPNGTRKTNVVQVDIRPAPLNDNCYYRKLAIVRGSKHMQ